MLFVSQAIAVNATAQSINVKLSLKNPTVADVIEKLSAQTGYEFSYDAEILLHRLNKNVSLDVKNERVESVLSRVFSGSDIGFRVLNNRVFLKSNKVQENTIPAESKTTPQQGKTVTGTIVDANGEPVIGATVVVQGDAAKGTVTDIDGNYILTNVPDNATLVVTYVGMKSQTIPVDGRTSVNITLAEDTEVLDEVVVVGYGTTFAKDLTGAVSTIGKRQLENLNTTDVSSMLQNLASGVQVSQNTGRPGERVNIRVRGATSFGANDPLYIVDGVPIESYSVIESLSPNDIQSMDILKDASAAAIYGSRAANGVVIITTMKGLSNKKPSISFGYNSTMSPL